MTATPASLLHLRRPKSPDRLPKMVNRSVRGWLPACFQAVPSCRSRSARPADIDQNPRPSGRIRRFARAHLFIVAMVAGWPPDVAADVSRWQQAGCGGPCHGLTSAATARMTPPSNTMSRCPLSRGCIFRMAGRSLIEVSVLQPPDGTGRSEPTSLAHENPRPHRHHRPRPLP